MSYSAQYEGGLNTVAQTFPPASVGQRFVGAMPKNGKITRVRFHGTAVEAGPLTVRVFIRDLDGANPMEITPNTDLAAAFTTQALAFRGVEVALENQAARDAKDTQAVQVSIVGTLVGDLYVLVNFEPRP